jgi:hypothetical protein
MSQPVERSPLSTETNADTYAMRLQGRRRVRSAAPRDVGVGVGVTEERRCELESVGMLSVSAIVVPAR